MLGPEQPPGRPVSNPDPVQALIEHWNGRAWRVQKSPDVRGSGNFLSGAAATSHASAWAVGNVGDPATDQTLIERWDGRTWTVQKSPDAGVPSTSSLRNGVAVTSATNASVALLFHDRPVMGMRAHAAAGAFRSESKYAAQTSVDIVHEGSRKLAGLGVKVGFVEGDQGGDVDDGVFGQARGRRGQEDVAGYGRQAGAGGDDGGDGGIQAAGIERTGLDDQDRAALGGPAAPRLA